MFVHAAASFGRLTMLEDSDSAVGH
jgi:hypothetical protein